MIADLVSEFRRLRDELSDKIEYHDTDHFRALDRRVSTTFERLLNHEPVTAQETQILINFFLETIAGNADGENTRLIERMRTHVATLLDAIGDDFVLR